MRGTAGAAAADDSDTARRAGGHCGERPDLSGSSARDRRAAARRDRVGAAAVAPATSRSCSTRPAPRAAQGRVRAARQPDAQLGDHPRQGFDARRKRGDVWLPPYHDMGLIGGILQPVYAGFPVTLMSPMRFLRDPVGWLHAVSSWRATTSGGPNFAYDLCLRKLDQETIAQLDLSSWRVAFTGAEPVRPDTVTRFAGRSHPPAYELRPLPLLRDGGGDPDGHRGRAGRPGRGRLGVRRGPAGRPRRSTPWPASQRGSSSPAAAPPRIRTLLIVDPGDAGCR